MYMSGVFTAIETAWYAVYNWTTTLFNSMHAWSYVMAAIMTMLIVRFAVYPFMKGRVAGSSDSVYDAYKINPGVSDHVTASNIGTEKIDWDSDVGQAFAVAMGFKPAEYQAGTFRKGE